MFKVSVLCREKLWW